MAEMLVLTERVRNSLRLGEGHFQEFKSALDGESNDKKPRRLTLICRDIAEALVAFANADGGALLIGVEDDGTMTGVPHDNDDVQKMLEAPTTHVHKKSRLPLQHANSLEIDGKTLLYFSVSKGTTQIYRGIRDPEGN